MANVQGRLDRALANTAWICKFLTFQISHPVATRKSLSSWRTKEFHAIPSRIQDTLSEIAHIKSLEPNKDNLQMLKDLECLHNKLLKAEELTWKQRSHLHQLRDGDGNTKYFHSKATSRGIWRNGNDFLFNNLKALAQAIINSACNALHLFSLARETRVNHPIIHLYSKWNPPDCTRYKLNVDAALCLNNSCYAFGCVIRNINGDFIVGKMANYTRACGTLLAELIACREGLLFALEIGTMDITMESDSQLAVNLVNGCIPLQARLSGLIQDIQNLMKLHP